MKKIKSFFKQSKTRLIWRTITGILMGLACISIFVFVSDPALVSSTMVMNDFREDETASIIDFADEFAGISQNSYLYPYFYSPEKDLDSDDVLILFLKVVDISHKDDGAARLTYSDFLEHLDRQEDKNIIVEDLVSWMDKVSIEDDSFTYAFELFSLADKEELGINKLLAYSEDFESKGILLEKTKVVFDTIERTEDWQAFINESGYRDPLAKVKAVLLAPEIRDGETFYAVPDGWMNTSELWKVL